MGRCVESSLVSWKSSLDSVRTRGTVRAVRTQSGLRETVRAVWIHSVRTARNRTSLDQVELSSELSDCPDSLDSVRTRGTVRAVRTQSELRETVRNSLRSPTVPNNPHSPDCAGLSGQSGLSPDRYERLVNVE